MELGFVGLGNMGAAIARNLMKAGHNLTVFNRTRQKSQVLQNGGARVASTPREAAAPGLVFTMLADDTALEQVVFGNEGILEGLPRGGAHISLSTISTALSRRLAVAHRDAGQHYAAAPVFGRPESAELRSSW